MSQFTREGYARGKDLLTLLEELAEEKGSSVSSITLRWMLNKRPYIVPIPGSRRKERILENALSDELVLSQEEMARIDRTLEETDFLIFGGSRIRKE